MKNAYRINFRLDHSTQKKLVELSGSKYGETMSEVIRSLIDKAYAELKSDNKESAKKS